MKAKSTCQSPHHQEWDCVRHWLWRKRFTRDKWCGPCRAETAGHGFYATANPRKGAAA